MKKKWKNPTSTLNKCSNTASSSNNKTPSFTTGLKWKAMKKKWKNPTSTLKECSTAASSSNNETQSFTTVVKRQKTVTTTITTTTTLQAKDNMDKDISLYICVLKDATDSNYTFTWFKLDPQARTTTKGVPLEPLTPLCQMLDSTPKDFQAVAFGSKIYTLGGFHWNYIRNKDFLGLNGRIISNKVFVCDTLASHPSWKECPSMKIPRVAPAAVAVDGLLYVIGSREANACNIDSWAEVFDPSSETWDTLSPAPQGSAMTENSVFSKERGELIVFSRKWRDSPAYAFHAKTRSWKEVPISPSNRYEIVSYRTSSLAVGKMVYTFHDRALYALDLSQPEAGLKKVYGLEEGIRQIPHYPGMVVHIVYIGKGKMCLVWYAVSSQRKKSIIIYCLKFWVGTCPGESRLLAVIDRCDEYIADGYSISNCLTI